MENHEFIKKYSSLSCLIVYNFIYDINKNIYTFSAIMTMHTYIDTLIYSINNRSINLEYLNCKDIIKISHWFMND